MLQRSSFCRFRAPNASRKQPLPLLTDLRYGPAMRAQPHSLSTHVGAVLWLGLPLVGGHLAQVAIGLTDTVMMGWYGVAELAAMTLANGIFYTLFVLGSGFAHAVMPLVASADARGDETQVRRATRMGLWLSLAVCALFAPPLWFSGPILRALGQDPALSEMAQSYLRIAGLGLVPALAVMVLKSYLAALKRTQVILWLTLAAAGVNVLGNYALIFGNFGAPEMGIRGAALSSVLTHLASLGGAVLYARHVLPHHQLFVRFWRPDPELLSRVFKLGWPISLTHLAESGLFVISAFLMGWLGTATLAAHGIAIQLASATFMVYLGLSNAATIRAGNAFGRGDASDLQRGALAASLVAAVVAMLAVTAFLVFPEALISLFLAPDDPDRAAIIATGTVLLALAALFQLVDGGQVVALGLLRGLQDTRAPMLIAVISYWGVGLPAVWLFCFELDLGGPGVWVGLVLGLTVAAVLLAQRFRRLARAFATQTGSEPAAYDASKLS